MPKLSRASASGSGSASRLITGLYGLLAFALLDETGGGNYTYKMGWKASASAFGSGTGIARAQAMKRTKEVVCMIALVYVTGS
jgi:hypothetical protein